MIFVLFLGYLYLIVIKFINVIMYVFGCLCFYIKKNFKKLMWFYRYVGGVLY